MRFSFFFGKFLSCVACLIREVGCYWGRLEEVKNKKDKKQPGAHIKNHPLSADLRKFAESERFAWETTGFEEWGSSATLLGLVILSTLTEKEAAIPFIFMCVLYVKNAALTLPRNFPARQGLASFLWFTLHCFPIISVSDARAKYNKFSPSGAINFYGLKIFRHTVFTVDKLIQCTIGDKKRNLLGALSLSLTFPHAHGKMCCGGGGAAHSKYSELFIVVKGEVLLHPGTKPYPSSHTRSGKILF